MFNKVRNFSRWINEPEQTIRIHSYLGWFWVLLAVVAVVVGFIGSTVFIAVLSIVALSIGHWSAVQGVRTELKQNEQMEQGDDELDETKQDKK